jgi:hypothetical protein
MAYKGALNAKEEAHMTWTTQRSLKSALALRSTAIFLPNTDLTLFGAYGKPGQKPGFHFVLNA